MEFGETVGTEVGSGCTVGVEDAEGVEEEVAALGVGLAEAGGVTDAVGVVDAMGVTDALGDEDALEVVEPLGDVVELVEGVAVATEPSGGCGVIVRFAPVLEVLTVPPKFVGEGLTPGDVLEDVLEGDGLTVGGT